MKFYHLLVSLLLAGFAVAQPVPDSTVRPVTNDTMSLAQVFKKGRTSGHFRYYFMATQNKKELQDFYGNAIGGGLKYETAPFYGFAFGIGGFFVYNVGSTNFTKTRQPSRYESALFDLEDPANTNDMSRLDALYIKYANNRTKIVFGKQLINTPFINPQDGRMQPTTVEGLYALSNPTDKLTLEGGWLYKFSPRSTVKWYSVEQSIGINPQGLNQDGSVGNYAGNLNSKGVIIAGVTFKPIKELQVKLFEQFTENIFNTAFLQADAVKENGSKKFLISVQYIRQEALNYGGNKDFSKTYFGRNNKVNILGLKIGVEKKDWHSSLNYTRIFEGGRFTSPREWGIEPLFTTLPRERNEGLGNVHAIVMKVKKIVWKEQLQIEAGYGHYYTPGVNNTKENKYGMPSYRHAKLSADYEFKDHLQGLTASLLLVYKGRLGSQIIEWQNTLNKVGMSHFNFMINYLF